MFIAFRKKLSASWLIDAGDSLLSPMIPEILLECQWMGWLLCTKLDHLDEISSILDSPIDAPANPTYNTAKAV